jgi:hypothetical protein
MLSNYCLGDGEIGENVSIIYLQLTSNLISR